MCDEVSYRLRQARAARGEDLAGLARRIGVRSEHLLAIEEGRFADLPAGIYGRAAVKSFAAAFGFDPAAMLAECEALLPQIVEPIAALARLRGGRVRRPETPAPQRAVETDDPPPDAAALAGWRCLAASALDGGVVVGLLLVVVVAALSALTAPVSALQESTPAFGLMGLFLAAGYFLCFGGVRGATVGERALGVEPRASSSTLTLRAVAERALLSATEDVRCIVRSGARLGRSTAEWVSSATHPAKG
jgi:hypothetical protein